METIIPEELLTFKVLETKIYKEACELAVETMRRVLEAYDKQLEESRNRAVYRHKGSRRTTVKTLFGEVSFCRTLYRMKDDEGIEKSIYLLDEALGLRTVGLMSENYIEKLVSGITTKSYRACAQEISETTGQVISSMGVWNVVQKLGDKLCHEEEELAELHKKGAVKGERTVPIIFEETDGVNLKLQRDDRKTARNGQAEMKVAIAYAGWKKTGNNRYSLDGKVAFAGFAGSKKFHRVREAKISHEYDVDEAAFRILNGDGAHWIKKVPDRDTVFQLDTFHRNKAIRENLPAKAQKDVLSYLEEKDIDGLFGYLEAYRNSLDSDEDTELADTLISYFCNNREGLLSYRDRGLDIPQSPEGLCYRNMGTMEGHIWSIVANRMKHNHTTWSKAGANHLAKILAKKCEGKLGDVTRKLELPAFREEWADEILEDVFSVAKTPKCDGKGYEYPVQGSLAGMKEALRGTPGALLRIAGFR